MAADYGLDAPRDVRKLAVRGAVCLLIGGVMAATNPNTANPLIWMALSAGVAFLATAGLMVWSSRVVKLKIRDRLLGEIPWRGDEQVLDVGCGRGLLLIGAAKRLTGGKATGVDIWRQEDQKGNSPEATLENAKTEGVASKVKLENADATALPFKDASFDVVLSSLVLHNIAAKEDRSKAVQEIARVLKPAGYVAIFDIFHTAAYANELKGLGFTGVRMSGPSFWWCVPSRHFIARKPE